MKKVIFFDTETTGLSSTNDRLVQIAWILVDIETNSEMSRGSYIIKPSGFDIPYRATEKHGIDTILANRKGEPLEKVMNLFNADLNHADILAGHNIPFDIKMISAEFIRLKLATTPLKKPSICTMRLSTNWCRIPKFNGGYGFKWPSLQELHFKLFGEDFENAHDALADILATKKCFDQLLKLKVIVIPSIELDFFSNLDTDLRLSDLQTKKTVTEIESTVVAFSEEEFFKAVDDDNTTKIVEGINSGIDINRIREHGWSPLQWAFWFNNFSSATVLIENGADLNARGVDGSTVLHICQSEKLLPYLIKYSENVDARTLFGSTPLHHHCVMGETDSIEILLAHGASINARCPDGEYVASRLICGELAEPFALQRALNNKCKTYDVGATALHFLVLGHAGYMQDFEYNANLLIEAGLSVDSLDEIGCTPFMYSIKGRTKESCTYLLDYGANAYAKDSLGNNILHQLADVADLTDQKTDGVNIDWLTDVLDLDLTSLLTEENGEGLTPLQLLCLNPSIISDPNAIEIFISYGADPYHQTSAGRSAWDIICQNSQLQGSNIYWKINQKRFL